MAQRLILLGTGGSAHDVLDIVEALAARGERWQVAGFLDDARPQGGEHLGHPVLGPLRAAHEFSDCRFVNVIGSDRNYWRREEILAATELGPERFATLVHPGACVSSHARLGRGVYVSYGASVGGGVVVRDQVSLCPGTIVGHDSVLGEYSILAPGAVVSGFVHVGRGCYVGARAVVRQRLRLGDGSLVGMGAVVVRDVEAGAVVVGNPAHPLTGRGGKQS